MEDRWSDHLPAATIRVVRCRWTDPLADQPEGQDRCRDPGQRPQILAPKHCCHGSRPLPGAEHGFSLCSTSMAPGFDESDPFFPGRDDLLAEYPEFADMIKALTRLQPHNV